MQGHYLLRENTKQPWTRSNLSGIPLTEIGQPSKSIISRGMQLMEKGGYREAIQNLNYQEAVIPANNI